MIIKEQVFEAGPPRIWSRWNSRCLAKRLGAGGHADSPSFHRGGYPT